MDKGKLVQISASILLMLLIIYLIYSKDRIRTRYNELVDDFYALGDEVNRLEFEALFNNDHKGLPDFASLTTIELHNLKRVYERAEKYEMCSMIDQLIKKREKA